MAGDKNTFGRTLQQFINKSPFKSSASIIDDVKKQNPVYDEFYKRGTLRDEILQKQSVLVSQQQNMYDENRPLGQFLMDKQYTDLLYAFVDRNKERRMGDYRTMAAFAEVADALDEICDEFINPNEHGEFINVNYEPLFNIEKHIQKEINQEFLRFINDFKLRENGWQYIRNLLIEGELFFEHIVHKDYLDRGILGVLSIPPEYVDPVYDNIQNLNVKSFLVRDITKRTRVNSDNQIVNQQNVNEDEYIVLDGNQVTYIHSGVWGDNRTFRVPFIENARRAYRQLTLIEDAIIIYRLVRAPERLVFNIDVTGMQNAKAEEYIKRLMNNYWSKKTFALDDQKRVQSFNPQSMLDAFWFPQKDGKGSSVDMLQGGQNLGDLQDLNYFIAKLYKALKVPVNRIEKESTYSTDGEVFREELKFANFIVRLQQQFAKGLKKSFITHLKFRQLWDKYDLVENAFNIEFSPPRNYKELRQQQVLDMKFNNFSNITNNEVVSQTYALKKYLGWSDEDIKSNREFKRRDAMFNKELMDIESGGSTGEPGIDGAISGGGAPAGGEDIPPDFGPAPDTDQVEEPGGEDQEPTPPPEQGQ